MRISTAFVVAALVGCSFFGSTANAQTNAIVAPGDAAVTGFSGIPYPPSSERIDRDGPALRVIALPGGGQFGLTDAQKIFTAKAGDVGQVFGVALDNQQAPNIFAAATAAYGLALYRPGHGRLRNGAPGAQYTPGQFGPADQGGGPDSIWRIDGTTGDITLFANVSFNGIQNTPASLGALAFDGNTQQLFVSDRATGLIHRFGMDGTDRGTFDHGVDARQAAGIPPVPFNPSTLANIQSGNFDAQNPRSWGFAPAERRVFALAMHYGRLYYSVAANSEIWSVGITRNGAFANDARYETNAPALRPGFEISQIAFDGRGWMYVAERGAPTGAPDFTAVAGAGHDRVLRFMPKESKDSSRGYWHLQADEYAVGMFPDFQNADGGVGLTCGRTMWSTGDRLLDAGNARPGTFPTIDGLQGNDSNLVKPQNMPPFKAWMVNYYDQQSDIASRGHMGSIAIRNVCGGSPTSPPPPPSGGGYMGFSCPPGLFAVDGECFLPPTCPPDTTWRNGYCVYPKCPFGFANIRGECRRPPVICRRDEVYVRDRCVPVGCPPELLRDGRGYCGCPRGQEYRDGRCVPPCANELRDRDGRCQPPCDRGQIRDRDGRCVGSCQPGTVAIGNCPCPRDQIRDRDGRCVPPCANELRDRDGNCGQPPCPRGEIRNSDNRCVQPPCPQGETRNSDNRCVANCRPGTVAIGNCPCPRGEVKNSDGRCVTPPSNNCPPSTANNCGQQPPPCPRGRARRNGVCVTVHHPAHCPRGETFNGRHCVANNNNPSITITRLPRKVPSGKGCSSGEAFRDGRCQSSDSVDHSNTFSPRPRRISTGQDCPSGQVFRDGHCMSVGGSNLGNGRGNTLACSRAEYDRLGHCPNGNSSNDSSGPHHSRYNGTNGRQNDGRYENDHNHDDRSSPNGQGDNGN